MKLILRLGAAIGIAAIGACNQTGQDNVASTENAAAPAEETVLPPDEGGAATDTLGNQLDQLNAAGENENTRENASEMNRG